MLGGTDEKDRLRLIRLSKVGNSKPWNAVFNSSEDLTIRILGPIASAEDHISFVFELNKSSHKNRETLILRTSTDMMPFGIGHAKEDKDLYLFKVNAEYKFDIYVADTAGTDKSILFQMFIDGSLDDEIRELNHRAA
ncbi:hypothetical protein [Daejeonella sp.]|uniref:hypothetical protein n=1 Tax=Daejeonella sp. TaxID=2805397 RepID=UPI0030C36F37